MPHDRTWGQDDHDRSIRNEERLCQTEEKWVAHATVHDLEAQALALQHLEYERRLEELNHEAARIAADKATFASQDRVDGVVREWDAKIEQIISTLGIVLPRETFDTFIRETYRPDIKARDEAVKSLTDWRNKAAGAALILAVGAGLIGAAILKVLGG